jgi:rfaE bifunctional protein kinase chain/domain
MNKVLVVGDAMLDRYYWGSATRISPEAPVPIIKVDKVEDRLGGAANVANNLAHLNVETSIIFTIGMDEPGLTLTNKLKESDIATFANKDAGGVTTMKLRTMAQGHQVGRVDFEKAPTITTTLGMLSQFERLVDITDVVIFSDYNKGALTHVRRMVLEAVESKKIVIVDPKGKSWDRYAGATIITPNIAELKEIVGDWNSEEQLATICKNIRESYEIENVLLTRSEHGMTLFNKDGRTHFDTQAKTVVDVTGAGDTVVAALAFGLANSLTMHESIKLANKAAGIVVSKLGTSTVSFDELM